MSKKKNKKDKTENDVSIKRIQIDEELRQRYLKTYNDDYLDEKFEKYPPYSKEFEDNIDKYIADLKNS